ncbi:unnamed protein product [Hymenolepis diminuta]|uniref:Anoct_dimer domain-containing protein n=1 Tax=Hymenolepis diminuta TaxID=6216 RepID=A0A0R3SZ38_HYMDI|nr:unnamed protein product [Hymenolepis diminuta]
MHLSSDDYHQRILRAAAHPSNEHVHSIGRILGDRNVMYKYINPNLLAVMTEGVSAMEGHSIISIYLVDTVAGRIIHSVVHRKAVKPTCVVVSENWFLEKSLYFSDGLRRIDYVIAFKVSASGIDAELFEFLRNLNQHGVDIEIEDSSGEAPVNFSEEIISHRFMEDNPVFAKLHVQWNYLLAMAAALRIQKPIVSLLYVLCQHMLVSYKVSD